MARTVRNAKIDTRSSRQKLNERREPYWTVISSGCAIGYRRGSKGGTWIARFRDGEGRQHYEALGAADDVLDPDGLSVFSFAQAQERARAFFAKAVRKAAGHLETMAGPLTVAKLMDEYFAARESRGSKGVRSDRYAAAARILPELGSIDVAKLTAKRIRDWHTGLASAAKLARTKATAVERATRPVDAKDSEALRARRSTANRVLTVLKAALNHAYQEGWIEADDAWRKVKPFREADSAIVRFLSTAESRRLVNGCHGAFRDLVRAALLTGCRYGELIKMRASDFNAEASTVIVREAKGGRPRHVALTDEGRQLFLQLEAGKAKTEFLFRRDDGETWKASHQQRPLEEASRRARLEPPATFHILRHTYASALAMKGVPMGVIAAQLGHADTRMTEKHYAHLAPNYVAETVRAAMGTIGIVGENRIIGLRT